MSTSEVHKEISKIAWNILIRLASEKALINYAEFAQILNTNDVIVHLILDEISYYCILNKLPRLHLLTIDEIEFNFPQVDKNRIMQEYFWLEDFDWKSIENPFLN